MQNAAIRIATHLRNWAKINSSDTLLSEFKKYFKTDAFGVIYCLMMIDQELEFIRSVAQKRGQKSFGAIDRVKSLIAVEGLSRNAALFRSSNLTMLAEAFDGYAIGLGDENLHELQKLQSDFENLLAQIDDPILHSIVQETIEAFKLYPCAGVFALSDRLSAAIGRAYIYKKKVEENDTIKKLFKRFDTVIDFIIKIDRVKSAIEHNDWISGLLR